MLSAFVLVAQVTEKTMHVTREDGSTAELTVMGARAWREPESPCRIRIAPGAGG